MDVLLAIKTTCRCCGTTSTQPVTAPTLGFEGAAGRAALDGVATDRGLRRGLQLCPACAYAAPSLACVPGPAGRARAVLASRTHRAALGRRAAAAAGEPTRDDATRWLAYAEGFARDLPPEAAGLAWVHAAAELEQPALHRLGSREAQPAIAASAAEAARRAAIAQLQPLFDAEFGPALPRPLAALRRALARRRLGETLRRPAVWRVVDHHMTDRRAEGRFALACTLTDLLRRVGEFVAAESVALRALHDPAVPPHMAGLLGYQLRLSRSRDDARHEQHLVPGNVVALPAPVEREVFAAEQAAQAA